MSIRARITLLGLGLVTAVICCLSASLFALISQGLDTNYDEELAKRADAAVASIATAPADSFTPRPSPLAPIDPKSSVDVFTTLLAADGKVLWTTGVPLPVPAEALAVAQRDGRASGLVAVTDKEGVRLQVRPWSRADLGLSGYVVVGQTTRRTQQDRAGLVVLFAVSGLITFVAAAVAVWVATGRALKPLGQMAVMADEVGRSQNLGRRLPLVSTKDAVGRLTTSFNSMMDRLQEAYGRVASALAAQQRFTADASHELRTPLTTIRNNAEFLLQHPDARPDDREGALRDIAGESIRMSRLIENLLTLARADGGVVVHREPLDLAVVAESVCRQATTAHPSRQIGFAATPARPVAGDEDMLRQLLWTLIDNAVKFTPDGGRVWVALTQRGSTVVLTVADNGTGLPPGSERRIFERFYRADAARKGDGAGLGLAIAAWIAREHGATIVAANNDRGGATFSVELPSADAATTVSLPLPTPTPFPPPAPTPTPRSGSR